MQPVSAESMYARGIERRERLLDTAEDLLSQRDLRSISLKEIAEAAGVSTSSAYHFYGSAEEVWAELAHRFGRLLEEAITRPHPARHRKNWQSLWEACIDRAVRIYQEHPAYQKLILGGQAPPAIKLADRDHDAQLGDLLVKTFIEHFGFQPFPGCERIFFIAVEIVDLILSLSVIREGTISGEMAAEAKLASRAYLAEYLHESLRQENE